MSEDNDASSIGSEEAAENRNLDQQERELEQDEEAKSPAEVAEEKAEMPSEEAAQRRNVETRGESKKKQKKVTPKRRGGERKTAKRKKGESAKAEVNEGASFDLSRNRDHSQDFSSNRDTSQDFSRAGMKSPKALAEEKAKLRVEEIAKEGAPGAENIGDVEKGYSPEEKRGRRKK